MITILAMVVFFVIMRGIRRHYDNVNVELAADEEDKVLPTRVHAIVLVSGSTSRRCGSGVRQGDPPQHRSRASASPPTTSPRSG